MLSNPQTIIFMLHTMYVALNIIQPELLNLPTDIFKMINKKKHLNTTIICIYSGRVICACRQ